MTSEPLTETVVVADEQAIQQRRAAILSLKETIKGDAEAIRRDKRQVRELQRSGADASGNQSSLAALRMRARARLLIYGTLRGRTWDRIESRHGPMYGALAATIKYIYTRDILPVLKVPMPAELEACLKH